MITHTHTHTLFCLAAVCFKFNVQSSELCSSDILKQDTKKSSSSSSPVFQPWSLGFTIFGEISAYVTKFLFLNPTLEVVTFHLRGIMCSKSLEHGCDLCKLKHITAIMNNGLTWDTVLVLTFWFLPQLMQMLYTLNGQQKTSVSCRWLLKPSRSPDATTENMTSGSQISHITSLNSFLAITRKFQLW